MILTIGDKRLIILEGDITKQNTDAIVNAANNNLNHGGGVARAIAIAAGIELEKESRAADYVQTGQCYATTAGNLNAKKVIHTVGPIWRGGGQDESKLLTSCIVNSLIMAESYNFSTISFPSISTGIYGYPIQEASRIMLTEAYNYLNNHSESKISEIRFVLFGNSDYLIYKTNLTDISRSM